MDTRRSLKTQGVACMYRVSVLHGTHKQRIMRVMAPINHTPFEVSEALESLASRIVLARKARLLKQADLAAMADISRSTLVQIERGSPQVAMGNYLAVVWALGLLPDLDKVVAHETDDTGQRILLSQLPKRVR
jgi:DNA-binding XRE family transcriptional regulator